jgi:hypothetical protein
LDAHRITSAPPASRVRVRFAVSRLLALEPLADLAQHGHVAVGPLDPLLTEVGESDVGDVVALLGGCQSLPFVASCGPSDLDGEAARIVTRMKAP